MSLNGLDHPAIVEAYQSALADAGGWFLLHYTSRDEVALLDRGTGGVPEVRNAIQKYEEPSPLYGFLHYRRRKVILRYMPEGTSRLVQARSNVQFQSVTEKFTPNDTILAITQASDLNESALSSACLLHTASGSITSSSSSLRRRRLREITEDAEENGTKEESTEETKHPPAPVQSEPMQRSGSQMSEATIMPPTVSPEIEKTSPIPRRSPDLRPPPSRGSSRAPSQGSRSETHSFTMSPKSTDSRSERSRYRNILDEFPRPSDEVRMSTQSSRPSLRDLERAAGIQPKIKLGPRPSVDQSGRPRTSGTVRNLDQRPVASLPAGMRPSSARRSNVEVPRPRSQGSSFASRPNSRAPPIPPLLVPPPSIPLSRPQLSPGAKSLGALSTSSGLTPEKERLMKALQQRKKQLARRAEEDRKNQTIAEEPRLEVKVARNQEENKENINLAPLPVELEPKKSRPQPEVETHPEPPLPAPESSRETSVEPQHEAEPAPAPTLAPAPEIKTKPEHEPEHEPEPQPDSQAGPQPEAQHVPSDPGPEAEDKIEAELQHEATEVPIPPVDTKPETPTDTSAPAAEVDPSSATSLPSAEVSISTEKVETSLENVQFETPQTVAEDETPAETIESTTLDQNETKGNLVPPSANSEVPLDEEPAEIPDLAPSTENASITPQPEVVSVDPEQSKPVTVEPAPAEAPESARFPVTPPADVPPSPETEPAFGPVSVSIDPAPLDEGPAEEPAIEKQNLVPLDQRRRIHLEPIQVPTPEYSDDDNLLSDDSFMEELRSATVQEARPVAVKTPNGDSWNGSRAVSSPHMASQSTMQAPAAGRSVSSSYPDNGPPTPVLMAKKINVSSGISNRIKALEKFSSREGTPTSGSHTVTAPSASSSFENLRKRASVSYASPEAFSRATGINQLDPRPGLNAARRTNSISVTARIVRDSGISPGSSGGEPSEPDVLNLQASPLTVEHPSAEEPAVNGEPVESTNHSEDRSMSVSSIGSGRQTAPASRSGSRLSLSTRSKTDETVHSTATVEEKKESRASRLIRRMSSITSTSRRSIVGAFSPPVKEDTNPVTEAAVSQSSSRTFATEPIDIGEVNVQFPDTLLWKRRFMRIDENGFLVLTPGTNDASARNMTKRYHLTEFRTPCLPDEDMQELPNSILLDFLDGSTLQCACESRQGQSAALQTLVDAHNAHQQ